jgi:polyisoprenoid-binding protein YceI
VRKRWIIAACVALPVVAFAAVYLLFFRGSNVAPLSLATPAATHSAEPATLVGDWTVSSGSTAGYRVREQLAFAPAASDAVGRTSAITGSATLVSQTGSVVITDAAFKVDVSKLTSDDPQRDNHLRTIGLETDTYPTATFKLTTPVVLPAAASTGATVQIQVTGDLTLHGVTKLETIATSMQQTASGLDFVGSLTFAWGDFNMTAPNVGGFVTVQSNPTMEFELVLTHA